MCRSFAHRRLANRRLSELLCLSNSLRNNVVKEIFAGRSTLAPSLHHTTLRSPSKQRAVEDGHKQDRQFSECSTKAKTKSRFSYAYITLADYRFIAAHVERERPAVAEPAFVTSVVADAGFSRAV